MASHSLGWVSGWARTARVGRIQLPAHACACERSSARASLERPARVEGRPRAHPRATEAWRTGCGPRQGLGQKACAPRRPRARRRGMHEGEGAILPRPAAARQAPLCAGEMQRPAKIMRRHACSAILLVAAALGARAESATSTPFDGAEAPWARASRQLFLGATSLPLPSLCTDACEFVSKDEGDDCDDDDGAPGSEFPMCAYCTDCMDYCPRMPRAPPPPPAGTPSGTGSPDAEYPNGQLGTDGADYGPGQSLPSPAASPAPLRAGTDNCTKNCFYDAECDDGGPGPECAYDNDCVDCDGRHSPGMICSNNCHNAGGSSCNDGGGPGSECLFCATRAVVSFKSAVLGTKRALASTHRAGMGTIRVVMGNMRVLVSGMGAVMGTLHAVVGRIRAVVGRIRAVASSSRAVTIRVVMGNLRAFVSSPSAVMGTLRAGMGTMRAVTSSITSSTSAVLGTIHVVMGNMRAVVSTSRAVRSAERAVVGTNLRAVVRAFRVPWPRRCPHPRRHRAVRTRT